jgi:hypothetical protein
MHQKYGPHDENFEMVRRKWFLKNFLKFIDSAYTLKVKEMGG